MSWISIAFCFISCHKHQVKFVFFDFKPCLFTSSFFTFIFCRCYSDMRISWIRFELESRSCTEYDLLQAKDKTHKLIFGLTQISVCSSNIFFHQSDFTLFQEFFRCNIHSDRIYISVWIYISERLTTLRYTWTVRRSRIVAAIIILGIDIIDILIN